MRSVVYTRDPVTGRSYRVRDAVKVETYAQYGPNGSGWGYMSFELPRKTGADYPDIGHAYEIELRKGPYRVLFSGQIVRITQALDGLVIYALGWLHAAMADVHNRIYCDTRYEMWRTSEEVDGHLRPDCFDVDMSERLCLKPRRGEADPAFVVTDDYTHITYAFPFGETATRFTADYDIALPNGFPAKVQFLAGDTVLSERTATASGSVDVTSYDDETSFEVRLVITQDLYSVDAEDDTVYASFENVRVYSLDTGSYPLDLYYVAYRIVALLSGAGHGLSADVDKIANPGHALIPAAFDADAAAGDVLTWCANQGDEDGNPVAWGVTFDGTRRLFVESIDRTAIKYVVGASDVEGLERSGDWSESAQVVYGVYQTDDGYIVRTEDVEDADAIQRLGGFYRRQAVDLSGAADAAQATDLLALYLDEHSDPVGDGNYSVKGAIRTPEGRRVPVDEILPGGLVQVTEWRAIEAGLDPDDYRDRTTTFLLTGVKVDHENLTAELTPDETSNAFERTLAAMQQTL